MTVINEFNEQTGILVKDLREELGMSQAELAKRMADNPHLASYNVMTVARTEKGKRSVSLEEALALSEVLQIDIETFLHLAKFKNRNLLLHAKEVAKAQNDLGKAYEDATKSFADFLRALDYAQLINFQSLNSPNRSLSEEMLATEVQNLTPWIILQEATKDYLRSMIDDDHDTRVILDHLNDLEDATTRVTGLAAIQDSPLNRTHNS